MKNTLQPIKEKIRVGGGGLWAVKRGINLTTGSSFKSSESNNDKADWTSAALFEASLLWHSDNNADLSITKADTELWNLQRSIRGFTFERKCFL